MESRLTGAHRRTYEAVFQHPVARNLHWRDVRAMLAELAQVVEEHNGNLKITRNGTTLVLHPTRDKDVAEVEELMEIRHFLDRSGADSKGVEAELRHLLVVIDHREARVYETELHNTVPRRITPYDPKGFGRNLHYVQEDSNGQRKPEVKSFYETIAAALCGADEILIFGSGTGASSAMEQLLAVLERDHRRLAGRVIGSVVLDTQHRSEYQLLAAAREFYAKRMAPQVQNGTPTVGVRDSGAD